MRWPGLSFGILIIFGILLLPTVIALKFNRQIDLNWQLVLAVKQRNSGLVQGLLDKGADANSCEGNVPALSYGEAVQSLVNAQHFEAKRKGPTCLLLTLETSRYVGSSWFTVDPVDPDYRIVNLLLDHGAYMGAQGPDHEYPLIIACRDLRWPAAKALIDHGADVNARSSGFSPLLLTAFHTELHTSLMLLQRGAKPNVLDKSDGWSPLMWAISSHNTELVKALIRYGADVNLPASGDRVPNKPLAYARFLRWCPDIVSILRKAGAS